LGYISLKEFGALALARRTEVEGTIGVLRLRKVQTPADFTLQDEDALTRALVEQKAFLTMDRIIRSNESTAAALGFVPDSREDYWHVLPQHGVPTGDEQTP
jgi:hypothetical protein